MCPRRHRAVLRCLRPDARRPLRVGPIQRITSVIICERNCFPIASSRPLRPLSAPFTTLEQSRRPVRDRLNQDRELVHPDLLVLDRLFPAGRPKGATGHSFCHFPPPEAYRPDPAGGRFILLASLFQWGRLSSFNK
jgi:hypothetical protein